MRGVHNCKYSTKPLALGIKSLANSNVEVEFSYTLCQFCLVHLLPVADSLIVDYFFPILSSIGARHFGDERLSRPPSGQKLVPIEKQLGADSDIKVHF